MKRKLYIHVGPHKTGTTLIQKLCLDNQSSLLNNNILYPKKYIRIFGHHTITDLVKNKMLSIKDSEFFNSNNYDILLSSESFINFSIDDIKYLSNFFKNFELHIIYCWRRASLKMYSIWQELVKSGKTASFFEFYHNHLARPGKSHMLSADLQINRFAKGVSNKNIHLIDYDRALLNDDLLENFFSVINCEYKKSYLDKSSNNTSRNKSLSPYDTELIRALNLIMGQKYSTSGKVIRESYLSHYDSLDKEALDTLFVIMKENVITLSVGDYFIDKKAEKVMIDKYQNNFINFGIESYQNSITLVKDNWFIDARTNPLLNCLAAHLNEVIDNV